jgi:hypothetical protein
MTELSSLAGQLNSVTNALRTLGIDSQTMQMTAAAFQAIGGTSQVIKSLITARQAYNAAKAAWGAANLAKYGPYGIAVGAMAVAGGVWIGQEIERYARVDDSDAGLRLIAGGAAYGRA